METININQYLEQNQIEEKIPYFGKARIYTLMYPLSENAITFNIPPEIFHFITAIYLYCDDIQTDYFSFHLCINDFVLELNNNDFSYLNNIQNKSNILIDPIFFGRHTRVFLKINSLSSNISLDRPQFINILVEYGKILPELYNNLHDSDSTITFLSRQKNKDLLQIRGNCI